MDPEMEELKQLVRRAIALSEDTNKRVHSMQRAARFSRLVSFLWWAAVLAISAFTYYYYVMPHLTQVLDAYEKAQGYQGSLSEFFSQLGQFGSSSQQ